MLRSVKAAWSVFRRDGAQVLRGKLLRRARLYQTRRLYEQWIAQHDTLTDADRRQARRNITSFSLRPLISVLMPVYNTDANVLRKAVESVRGQIYENWELCIADDCSTRPHVREILDEYASIDPRIKVVYREKNGHISAASNSALEIVTGKFTALLDHDDILAEQALYFVAKELDAHSESDIIYSDEDKIDESGRRYEPFFKPDWSPDLLMSVNYVNHLTVYRTSLLRDTGGFRAGFEGSQDYDVLLRVVERTRAEKIRHIPKILYHWRAVAGSVAHAADEKPYAHERARKAIAEHLERQGIAAQVSRGIGQLHRVEYEIAQPKPPVSVVVTAVEAECDVEKLHDLIDSTGGVRDFELIIIGRQAEHASAWAGKNISCVEPEPGERFSMLNVGAGSASGSVLCFLDLSTTEASQDWLRIAIGYALQEHIGAVGGMISDEHDRIVHAGLTLGLCSGVDSVFRGEPLAPRGRALRLDVAQNVSAVSADCFVVRRDLFEEVGGFDAVTFPARFGDVDLCLKFLAKGRRNIWTPWISMLRRSRMEDMSADSSELERLQRRWAELFAGDPYYNPNLSLETAKMSIAAIPRIGKL